jgi:hypothetical protein
MNTLTPDEVKVIQMSLSGTIMDLKETQKDQRFPFTPEARRDMKDILRHMESALSKIALTSGHLVQLDPYVEGDEKDFLTKQS